LRLQRYCFFLNYQQFWRFFLKKSAFSHFAEFVEMIHFADFQSLRVLLKNSLFFG